MIFYGIALGVAAIDLLSKLAIEWTMSLGDTLNVWDSVIHFELYKNSGAAGSSFQGYARFFAVLAILFIWFAVRYKRQGKAKDRVLEIGLAVLVGGAAGNGVERLLFGEVTDFLVFGSRSGIMNIADLAINAGVVLLIVGIWRQNRTERRVTLKATGASTEE
ncbi:signal peptidase II [Cohnella faecalis]|uniref:Lipoprotein signal peptidase n=1 Tax=Cohnella faecalis TaxID=2315694 RepID=A0A398CRY8_9BACL|nr:signal peptidase II [Cohnella faecalis]RIE05342.1 signal peptidase II [Cohnella faecalis]